MKSHVGHLIIGIVLAAVLLTVFLLVRPGQLPRAAEAAAETERPGVTQSKPQEIYLAGGCFWGMEAYFQKVYGILDTEVGYANGRTETAGYRDLHASGHAETVKIVYDAQRISLAEIIDRYLRIIDPLSVNQQGNDRGTQYRTGIYYTNEADRAVAAAFLDLTEKELGQKPVVELEALKHFVPAEAEHQDYLKRNPGGYCHIGLSQASQPLYPGNPKPTDEELKRRLSPEAYDITQKAATERPGSSAYNRFDVPGIYVDVVTGQPLFSTDDQFDGGCGWPSFSKPITTDVTRYRSDASHGMERTEVKSQGGDSHLGHVFDDGPPAAGGLRYCINGAALRFIPYDQMAEAGYERLMPYVQKR